MHLSSVYTVILFTGLVYGQATGTGVPSAIGTDYGSALFASVEGVEASLVSDLIGAATLPASNAVNSTAVPVAFPIGSSTGGALTGSMTTATSPAATGASVLTSATTKVSGTAGTSSESARGGASGTSAKNATKPTTASASPTNTKKSAAGQLCGFVGGAGIVLLVAMLAGL